MRELFRIIKEHIILLTGTGLLTYNLFNFNSKYHTGIDIPLKTRVREVSQGVSEIRTYPIATYYYYEPEKIILITLGAILIVIGLLKIRNRYIDKVEKNVKN